jgi:type I restriction enzyme S subunit
MIFDWEQRQLGEQVTFYSGLTYSPNNVTKQKGTFVLRSSNVQNNTLIDADNVYVDSEVVNSKNVEVGDVVVVVRNGSKNLIGKHAMVITPMNKTVIGAFMTGIVSDNPSFINALFDTSQFYREIHKNLGATINQITTGKFKEMKFLFPTTEEQIKIGNLFKVLDKIIALHQRKFGKIQELKEGLLQQLFPQKNEKKPRLRFTAFGVEWEQRKLGEEVEITMGTSPKSENYTQNPEDYVLVQGNADIKQAQVKPRIWTKQVTNVGEKGDIILTVRAPVGEVGITQYNVVLGRGVAGIKGNQFMFQLLRKMKDNNFWRQYSTGSTFEAINSKEIKNAIINIPLTEEQNSIGNFFQRIDKSINFHQKKVNIIKTIKKIYLQKMFI